MHAGGKTRLSFVRLKWKHAVSVFPLFLSKAHGGTICYFYLDKKEVLEKAEEIIQQ